MYNTAYKSTIEEWLAAIQDRFSKSPSILSNACNIETYAGEERIFAIHIAGVSQSVAVSDVD